MADLALSRKVRIFPLPVLTGKRRVKGGSEQVLSKRFILIAEDDEDDRTFYEVALKELAGWVDFKFVGNGRELIDYLSSRDSFPDLIFLSINMPLMDGLEALRVMRSHPKFKDIPVVCFTTSSSAEERNFCLAHGASFYTKPPSISEFSAVVQSEIGHILASWKETKGVESPAWTCLA